MKGIISVAVYNNRVQYKFSLRRNLTILRGDSATGKTTLIDMVQTYANNPDSGITLICEKECRVIVGEHWKEQLQTIRDSVVFIDEGNRFLKTDDFASEIKKTDNYFVIVSRDPLPALPYSVEEVYGIVNKTKGYGRIKRLYSGFKNLYSLKERLERFDSVIVEDSNAGYAFFKDVFEKAGIPCVSANGKSNIAGEILKMPADSAMLVIADGAAFGPEMEAVLKAGYLRHVELYLPESFEWIILKSGLIENSDIKSILTEPSAYIESREYFSWERFFNALLTERTKDTYLAYNKRKLNAVYLQSNESSAILAATPFQEKLVTGREAPANPNLWG